MLPHRDTLPLYIPYPIMSNCTHIRLPEGGEVLPRVRRGRQADSRDAHRQEERNPQPNGIHIRQGGKHHLHNRQPEK